MDLLQSINWVAFGSYAIAIVGFGFNIILLILNYRDVREIRNHQSALKQFEEKLIAVRPLYSTLYSTNDDIMELAVTFVKEASEIFALGTINSLRDTEIRQDEKESDFKARLRTVDSRTRAYISATAEYIMSGSLYCRVMNFNPVDDSDDAIFEILANVNFFLRLYHSQASVAKDLNLELYHNAEATGLSGDFHFRCSDKQVVIRTGSAKNAFANSAIVITDTRVITQFQQYYKSLLHSPQSKQVHSDDLKHLEQLLQAKDLLGVSEYLANLISAKPS